jgi:hypothetical protein
MKIQTITTETKDKVYLKRKDNKTENKSEENRCKNTSEQKDSCILHLQSKEL